MNYFSSLTGWLRVWFRWNLHRGVTSVELASDQSWSLALRTGAGVVMLSLHTTWTQRLMLNAQPLLSSQTLYQFQTVQTKLDNFKHFLGRFLFPLGYWGSYSSTLQIKSNSEYNLIWLNISPQTEAMVHQTEWNRKSDMKLQRPTGNRNVAECEPNIEIWTNTVITSQTSEEKLSQELIQSIQIVGSKYKNEF